MISAPHHLASQAGLAILREGGNAVEAAVAAAAAIAVAYPHMNGLGGDAFWLIAEPNKPPVSIDGAGGAGSGASVAAYRALGLSAVPEAGPLAAATVAGAVSSWQAALELSNRWGGRLPLSRLFEDAVSLAEGGVAVTANQVAATRRRLDVLRDQPGFAAHFLVDGAVPEVGHLLKQPALAATFRLLAKNGLDDFYRGEVGRMVGVDLVRAGTPVVSGDLARHRSIRRRPLSLNLASGHVFNTPPPTQGLASLMILGLFDRLGVQKAESFEHLHGIIEATKQAFLVRDTHVTDPSHMHVHSATYLSEHLLDRIAASILPRHAMPWPKVAVEGDTVWIGVVDGEGRAVSFIQSLAQPFGSGVVLPESGLVWHNRAVAFELDEAGRRPLLPHRKPFHTLSPALARLKDGSVMVWGSAGGEGQPQTQAAIFTRHVLFGQDLQSAITAPRWLLGRSWQATAEQSGEVLMEARFDEGLLNALRRAGHKISLVQRFDPLMGQAGALVRTPQGVIEGASDPRSDGSVAGF